MTEAVITQVTSFRCPLMSRKRQRSLLAKKMCLLQAVPLRMEERNSPKRRFSSTLSTEKIAKSGVNSPTSPQETYFSKCD